MLRGPPPCSTAPSAALLQPTLLITAGKSGCRPIPTGSCSPMLLAVGKPLSEDLLSEGLELEPASATCGSAHSPFSLLRFNSIGILASCSNCRSNAIFGRDRFHQIVFLIELDPQRARKPPSTTSPVPVTNDESSEHNHNIASATSCDCPSLPTGSIAA